MIAFLYVDKFAELAELPQLKRLDVLEEAHRRVSGSWIRNLANFIICLAIAFAVGLVPRIFFQMPVLVEGLLLAAGILVSVQVNQKLYAKLLHQRVREVLIETCL